jgi:hypothetical protein
MADRKGKSSQKRNKRRSTTFAQFKGKIIDRVEAHTTDYGCAIGIMFDDRTYLCFEVETGGVTILTDLSDWKTGNYKPLKRWKNFRLKLGPAARSTFLASNSATPIALLPLFREVY